MVNGQGLVAIQNLIKIEISKIIVLLNTLDDSENWSTYNFVLFFSLACLGFVFCKTLVEHLYCDKGLHQVVFDVIKGKCNQY